MNTSSRSVRALPLDRLVGNLWVLPLRALPYIAPATLRPGIIARALADPDERGAIDAHSLTGELGQLELRSPAEFLHCLHDIEALEETAPVAAFAACLPPGIVTPLVQARQLHWEILAYMTSLKVGEIADDTWNEEPALSTDARKLIFEGFPTRFVEQRGVFRANSSALNEDNIRHYVDELLELAKRGGARIDTTKLPGTKAQMREALGRLETSDRLLPKLEAATFDDYLKRMGLRWSRGRRSGGDNCWLRFIPNSASR